MKYLFTLIVCCAISMVSAQTPGSHTMLDFNGSSTSVDCGTVNLDGAQITMAAWVKVDAFKTAFPFITSIMGTEAAPSSALIRLGDAGIPSNIVQFVLRINGAFEKLDAVTGLSTNRWYHIACTYDGSEMRIYINGMLDASMTVTGSIESNELFELGRNYGNDRILDGQLDEASVWTTALSQTTIRDWMCKKITNTHPNYADLEGYWRMDDGSGTTVTDLSGNGHTGTFVGTPQWQSSSAPLGDESMHDYAAPFDVSLSHPSGGVFQATSASTAAELIHVYRVDELPGVTQLPNGVDTAQNDHYWGVFAAGTTGSIAFDYNYNYTGVSLYQPSFDCNATLLGRPNGAASAWIVPGGVTNDAGTQTMSNSGITRGEFWTARADSFNLAQSGPLEFCNGDSVVLTMANLGLFTLNNVSWFQDGVLLTGETDTVFTAQDSGTYSATATTASGCVLNFLPVMVDTDPGDVTIGTFGPFCEGDAAVALSGGTPNSGFYKVNGVFNPDFDPGAVGAGTHEVRYVVFGANLDCSDSASTQVVVFGSPAIDFPLDTNICEGEMLDIDVATPTGGTYSGTGVTGTEFDASVSGAGSFEVTYTVASNEGCEGSESGFVNVNLNPAAPDITISSGTLVSSTGLGNQWYLNGTAIDGATSSTYTPTQNGVFQLTVTDINGCTSPLSEPVNFVGTEELANASVSVFPNPVSNSLSFQADQPVEEIEVIDFSGRVVVREAPQTSFGALDVTDLARGSYMVHLRTSERSVTKRILVEP